MSAVANIVLADAQATPVNHTFVPIGPDKQGVWWWEDQSTTSSLGYNRISAQLIRPGNPAPGASAESRMNRVKLTIHTPKLEVLSNTSSGFTAVPTVAYIPRSTHEFILSDRAVVQDRKDSRKYAAGLLADAQIIDMIENLRNVF